MSRMHRSVYFDICCYIWDTNEPCPRTELPLMLGDMEDWTRFVDDLVLSGKLTRNRNGSLSNSKAHAEAKRAFELWEKKSKGGKVGAKKTNNNKAIVIDADDTHDDTPDVSSPKMVGTPAAEPEPEPEPELEKKEGSPPKTSVDASVEAEEAIRSFAARFGRAGGVAVFPSRPAHFAQQLDTIRHWIEMGLDPDTEIVPALEQDAVDNPGDRHSLKYFTPMMARMAARKDAINNGYSSQQNRTEPTNSMVRAVGARRARRSNEAGSQ